MLSGLGGNTVTVFDATSFCLESRRSKICLRKKIDQRGLVYFRTPRKMNIFVCAFAWQIYTETLETFADRIWNP